MRVRVLIWGCVLFLLSGSIAAAADLAGTWVRSDGTGEVIVSQNGQQITAIWSKIADTTAQNYGVKAGDQYFYGTLYGPALIGKIVTHFPVKYKTLCPALWETAVDIVLMLSSDVNTLSGQFQNNMIHDNCTTTAGDWTDQVLTRKEPCIPISDDLKISLACAEYHGVKYKFNLNYASDLLWKADLSSFGASDAGTCISVGSDLSLKIPIAGYKGSTYAFTLTYFQNKADSSGIYWQIDPNTLVEK